MAIESKTPTSPNSPKIRQVIASTSPITYTTKKTMNHKAETESVPKLDLKLNLSPPSPYPPPPQVESPNGSVSSMEISPLSSCVSSELSPDDGSLCYASSPEEAAAPAKPMMLAGCPRCLMYVMLSEEDPKCPKCKSTVLLQILHEEMTHNTTKE